MYIRLAYSMASVGYCWALCRKEKKHLSLGMSRPEGTMQIEPVYKLCSEQMWNATSHLGSAHAAIQIVTVLYGTAHVCTARLV